SESRPATWSWHSATPTAPSRRRGPTGRGWAYRLRLFPPLAPWGRGETSAGLVPLLPPGATLTEFTRVRNPFAPAARIAILDCGRLVLGNVMLAAVSGTASSPAQRGDR